jgi:hypothetical protein
MKEIWSKYCFDHSSFISYPFGLFLGSFESPRVSTGIPVTIPINSAKLQYKGSVKGTRRETIKDTTFDAVDLSRLHNYHKPNFWARSHNSSMFDGTCERVSTGKSYRTQGERTQTVSHPATRHFMMFCPVLISESVIVTPQVHMFKLRTFAFLNLRPRELTGGSGDTSM